MVPSTDLNASEDQTPMNIGVHDHLPGLMRTPMKDLLAASGFAGRIHLTGALQRVRLADMHAAMDTSIS